MKSIVVYKIIILSSFLILATGLTAQKPAIDLISSHQQYRHPEAIIDTGFTVNPMVREAVLVQARPAQNQELRGESEKKKRRQIGPSLDSLFQKEDNKSAKRDKPPVKISGVNRRTNPFRILIYIIAIK